MTISITHLTNLTVCLPRYFKKMIEKRKKRDLSEILTIKMEENKGSYKKTKTTNKYYINNNKNP